MYNILLLRSLTVLTLTIGYSTCAFSADADCGFSVSTLSFKGNEIQQARCLLRTVQKGGKLSPELNSLPVPFNSLPGQSVTIDGAKLKKYITDLNLPVNSVGGSLDDKLSRSSSGDKPTARYFVIHDTSWNLCDNKTALDNSDAPSAKWNLVKTWENYPEAHLFITRDGKVISPQGRTFADPWRATQLEKKVGVATKGLFLHVENVQLRTVDVPEGKSAWVNNKNGKGKSCLNDRIAQQPGFSDIQLSRLALAYVAASYRKGSWLVPAFHASIDAGIAGVSAHDDPQNFELDKWGKAVCTVLKDLDSKACDL